MMRKLSRIFWIALPLASCPGLTAAQSNDLDHATWDRIVKQYVTPEARVDYSRLKHDDRVLEGYLSELAAPWPKGMTQNARKAALINAYNALTVHWILTNYPVKSIWRTRDPFREARHTLDGENVSLDQIEGQLRALGDPRIHSALVCAARSCPPLRREAYVAARVDEQLDENFKQWLANPRANEFFPDRTLARVSRIFQWYAADFEQSGGVREFLARFAPPGKGDFLRNPESKIQYENYHWGLNDAGSLGSDYSQLSFHLDWARNGYLFGAVKDWFFSLGRQYGVNPIIFGSIYVGAIPFFSLSIAWLIRNLRRHASPVLPALCASACFVSAYVYLLFAGKNIPAWVYIFIVGLIAFGVWSAYRKIKSRLREGGPSA